MSGRARKRACRRDQSVSCHCDYVGGCDSACVWEDVSSNVNDTYHDGFIAGTVLLLLTRGNADWDGVGPISLR